MEAEIAGLKGLAVVLGGNKAEVVPPVPDGFPGAAEVAVTDELAKRLVDPVVLGRVWPNNPPGLGAAAEGALLFAGAAAVPDEAPLVGRAPSKLAVFVVVVAA